MSDSLAGAVAASRHLPASQGAELLHTAREAFTASLHVTGVIAAVIFAGLAVPTLAMRPATRTKPAMPAAACRDRTRRASSTTCTAGSADSPRASLPMPPGGRAR